MHTRRQFLGTISMPAGAALAVAVLDPLRITKIKQVFAQETKSAEEIASDEKIWFEVQQAFTVDRSMINLNSGGVSPSPAAVQESMKRYLDYSNSAPVYTMWRILEPQREGVRKRLARFFGCNAEEIALTRNASEGLEIQIERRNGIILKQISLPVPAEDENKLVSLFEENITPRTRIILICHMIFLTGQILPVKKIVHIARKKDIPVIVDGAHSFAHCAFFHSDLDCDYFATSLHKWTYAPHGTGFLYVRREKIKELWPLMAAPKEMDNDIRKFEEIGTHPASNYLAIADALTFNLGIGIERKEKRMRFLRDRWAKRLLQHDRIRLHTSLNPKFSCGIATVEIKDIDSGKLSEYLWKKYRIIVTPIKHPEFEGIRISPNLFTTLEEIDRFSEAMEDIIKRGIEA